MKKLFTLTGVILSSIFVVQMAHAGMIDYKRRNANSSSVSSGSASKDFKVTNRVEGMYDKDQNGYLSAPEVKVYLSAVADIVDKRGDLKIESTLFKQYDSNNDGMINHKEVAALRTAAR